MLPNSSRADAPVSTLIPTDSTLEMLTPVQAQQFTNTRSRCYTYPTDSTLETLTPVQPNNEGRLARANPHGRTAVFRQGETGLEHR